MGILDVSAAASDAMLNGIAAMLSGANLELLSQEGELLVSLSVSDPGTAIDGTLEFELRDGIAELSGEAKFGRVVAADGREIMGFDCGDERSDATLKLNATELRSGGGVRLVSFKLVLP